MEFWLCTWLLMRLEHYFKLQNYNKESTYFIKCQTLYCSALKLKCLRQHFFIAIFLCCTVAGVIETQPLSPWPPGIMVENADAWKALILETWECPFIPELCSLDFPAESRRKSVLLPLATSGTAGHSAATLVAGGLENFREEPDGSDAAADA